MKVTEVKVGQVWKNYKTKVEKSVASVTEDEAMMDDMKYIPIKTLLAGKSWKCVSENAVEHEKENENTEEVAGDGTPYSEVMEEIVQDEKSLADHYINDKKKAKKTKKKSEKAEKPKKEVDDTPKIITKFKCNINKESIAMDIANTVEATKGMTAILSDNKCSVSIVRDMGIIAKITIRGGCISIDCCDSDMVKRLINAM